MASITTSVNKLFKGMCVYELVALAIFAIYFIFPFQLPKPVHQAFESIPGVIFLFCAIVYLFIYVNPVLGIFSILAVYEMMRKSTTYSIPKQSVLDYIPAVDTPVYSKFTTVEPPASVHSTLEESIVGLMAPVGHSDVGGYVDVPFRPIAESVGSASLF
jgi:hypothetical protein